MSRSVCDVYTEIWETADELAEKEEKQRESSDSIDRDVKTRDELRQRHILAMLSMCTIESIVDSK